MAVITIRKRRFKRPRKYMPTGRRPLRARSFIPKRTIFLHKGKITLYKHRRPLRRIFRRFHAPLDLWRRFGKFGREIKEIENIWKRRKTDQWKRSKKKSWRTVSRPTYRRTRSTWNRSTITWRDGRPKKKPVFKKKKPFIKKAEIDTGYIKLPRFGKKGFVYTMRGGARDMSGRKYKNYGPFPKWFGPTLIFKIYPTSQFKASLAVAKMRGIGKAEFFSRMIKKYLDIVRSKLLIYAEKTIGIYVPKETGDLQEAMLDSLKESKRMGYRLSMTMKASIDYAGVVNKMSEKKLRHPKKVGDRWMRGRRSGKTLDDPKAQKGSYALITMLLKGKAKKLVREMIDDLTYVLAFRQTITKPKPTIKTYYVNPYETGEEKRDRESAMRYSEKWKQAQETSKHQVNYPKHLIKGWFKIEGLYKYR